MKLLQSGTLKNRLYDVGGGQVKAPIYHLDMLLFHENKRALTEEEVEAFISAYIKLCEEHGLWTSGGIYEDDEYRKT